jgi:GNAT superfamily N-acetyltransferase
MTALGKSGHSFMTPGRAHSDPFRSFAESKNALIVAAADFALATRPISWVSGSRQGRHSGGAEGNLIRKATRDDISRIFEIRGAVKENRLRDPNRVTVADCEWFIDNSVFWLWVEDGSIQGFSAADPRDGSIFALFVHPTCEGRGIGQKLLPLACGTLEEAGHQSAILATEPTTRAERFYRLNGWTEIGRKDDGQIVFRKNI